jgi:hypothetical protein
MKWIPMVFALMVLTANAGDQVGQAMEYHFQGSNTYFVISTTEFRAFLDLRTYETDKVVQSVVLSSRYMPPIFETKDVAGDNGIEFLVRTRDGGTGIAITQLKIYGLINSNIRKLGDFVVELESESWPEPTRKETREGEVTFPEKNRLIYHYTQVIALNGTTVTNKVSESYAFNSKSQKFEKTKSPNPTSDGIRQPATGSPKPSM